MRNREYPAQDYILNLFAYKDGNLIWANCKNKNLNGTVAGSIGGSRKVGFYRSVGINGVYYKVHRLIYCYHNGYYPKIIDHINGDSLDNRIENLRESTPQLNAMNCKLKRASKSNIKGVTWSARHKGWRARISINKKRTCLGVYKDLKDAANVYKEKCVEIYGEWRQ